MEFHAEEKLAKNQEHQLIRLYLYVGFGTAAVITNLIVIAVFMSAKDLRQRFVLFIILAVSDCVNGISYLVAGIARSRLIHRREFYMPITQPDCMLTMPWPALLIVAGQLPAATTLAMSVERIIAVQFPLWFKAKWTMGSKLGLVSIAWLGCLAGLLAAVIIAVNRTGVNSTKLCSVMETVGSMFGTIHFAVISLAFLISFVSLIAVFIVTRNSKVVSKDDLRRQKLLLYVTLISVILVAFPHLVLIFDDWKMIRVSDLFIGISYCSFAASSIINLFVYLLFRPDFRNQMIRLLTLKFGTAEKTYENGHGRSNGTDRGRNNDELNMLTSSHGSA